MKFNIKKFFMYFIILLILLLFSYSLTEPLYTPTAISVNRDVYNFPKIIAHKSIVSSEFSGNTIKAIKSAVNSGVDGIEIDIRMSKDNVLFLYHGDTLEEYTNGHGKPEDFNWSSLAKLVYKGGENQHLAKLEEVLQIVGSKKFIFLDVKHTSIFNRKLALNVISMIKKHHLQSSVFVESFNPVFLAQLRLESRDIMLMYDFVDNTVAGAKEQQSQFNKIPWILQQSWVQKQIRRIIRPDVLGPRFNINKELLKGLIAKGYPVISWTVDDIKTAKYLYKIGVRGLESNVPKLLQRDVLRTKYLYDAGGSKAEPTDIINVITAKDVVLAVNRAIKEQKNITIAGVRHSMGGQTLLNNSLQLNMLRYNKVKYNQHKKTVTAQAGATWQKIQTILNQYNRSVKIMQSDNIFTVGGSVGVNVHGWQVSCPPIASTIVSMTVVDATGKIKRVSKDDDSELFSAIIGGYGLFAVILDVEFETTVNNSLKFNSQFFPSQNLYKKYTQLLNNDRVELAFARLSVDKDNLFEEAGLFWFEYQSLPKKYNAIQSETLVALKRWIFRMSEYSEFGKKLRWYSEKQYSKFIGNSKTVSRNDAMSADIHVIWPLYSTNKDILQEYFIPKGQINAFLEGLKTNIKKYKVNILNVTIREVKEDKITALPYAKNDVFALVCLFSQESNPQHELIMKNFTIDVISLVNKLKGSFYLPYRLHHNKENLLGSYPDIKRWLALKKKYDKNGVFNSLFYQHMCNEINKDEKSALMCCKPSK